MKKRTNKESIVQFLILIMTSFLIMFGLISGKMNKYVHPRFHVGLWISAFILLLFAISVLTERKKGWHNVNLRQYFIYAIPLLIALTFPPVGTSSSAMILTDNNNAISSSTSTKQQGISGSEENTSQAETPQGESQFDRPYNGNLNDIQTASDGTEYTDVNDYLQDTQDTEDTEDTQDQDTEETQDTQDTEETEETQNTQDIYNSQEKQDISDVSEIYSKKEIDGSYIIEDASFANWYMDLYDHLDDFVGKRYQFLAQVYSMEGLEENQFLAGRYFMVCCAVDLTGYGIICESELRSELKEDQWITITATITKSEYDGTEIPVLKDAIINEAEAPKDEYIFYNNY
jgi:putative membrane protein